MLKKWEKLVSRITYSGVELDSNKRFDYTHLYNSVKKFGEIIDFKYKRYKKFHDSNLHAEAAYEILSLVVKDKNITFPEGHNEAKLFINLNSKTIFEEWYNSIPIVKTGEYINYALKPLSNADLIILCGLVDIQLLIYLKSDNLDKDILPNTNLTPKKINYVLDTLDLKLTEMNIIDEIIDTESMIIESTYLQQLNSRNIKLSSTNDLGLKGALLGDYLLVKNSEKLNEYLEIKKKFKQSWGIKTYSLYIDTLKKPKKNRYLNIRILKWIFFSDLTNTWFI